MMKWNTIKNLVDMGMYVEAREEIDAIKSEETYDDILAILDAVVCREEGDRESLFSCISKGLSYNYKNYELYIMLGEYYCEKNLSQAYLCYENAEFYCDVEEDREYILECKDALKENMETTVSPVSIVIVSYNNKQMMIDCVNSIRNNNLESTYQIIAVDNASDDGICEWLDEQDDILLISNQDNKGFGTASNQGVKAAVADNDIFFLNNDTLITPNAIFWLRMGLYENERIGAVGSESNYVGNGQVILEKFSTTEEYIRYGEKNNIPKTNPYEKKIWLSGFALLIKREALDNVGLFDLKFGKGYYEDNDMGVRLQQAGYQCLLCRNSFIFHYGAQSFRKNVLEQIEMVSDNREYFKKKWGFDIEYYTDARHEIIGLIDEDAMAPIKVLEIGCGCGATLSKIQYLWPNAEVRGIEVVKKIADIGGNYMDIIQGNIENMELPYEKEHFDYIIFTDVLECLYWPERVLRKMKTYLKENGTALFSIHNIMHLSVVLPLLKGEFVYEETRILDKAHIRFFTLKSIMALLQKCDYKIEKVSYTYEEVGDETIKNEIMDLLSKISGEENMAQFEAYQYIVKAVNLRD